MPHQPAKLSPNTNNHPPQPQSRYMYSVLHACVRSIPPDLIKKVPAEHARGQVALFAGSARRWPGRAAGRRGRCTAATLTRLGYGDREGAVASSDLRAPATAMRPFPMITKNQSAPAARLPHPAGCLPTVYARPMPRVARRSPPPLTAARTPTGALAVATPTEPGAALTL